MKSIQSKIIILTIIGIVFSSTIIGGLGLLNFQQVIDDDSVKIVNLTCNEKAEELNNILRRIEQSVEILSVYAIDNLTDVGKLATDQEYLEQYTKKLDELGLTIANETSGAVAVYARFNPNISNPKAGFFKVLNTESGQFEDFELTDFTQYRPGDVEHVGWYYIPVNQGKAVWMQPYYNKNIDVYMISYVIPIYKDSKTVGVVGMDIDFNYITAKSDSIQIYDTGYAFLTDEDFRVVYSKEEKKGTLIQELSQSLAEADDKSLTRVDTLYKYTANGVKRKVAFQKLENGMVLAVTAPVSEIDRNKYSLVWKILVIEIFMALLFLFLAWVISATIVKPLRELNVAAKEIANGNLDIELTCKSKDEVGTLSESLRQTAYQLKTRIDYINNLAYLDKLTGVRNNTAYLQKVSQIKEKMLEGNCQFAIFVVDVNGLKFINDNYGHDQGNTLIITASEVLSEVFGEDHVYRIGGDEFTVLLEEEDIGSFQEWETRFREKLQCQDGKIRLSAAIGGAVYDADKDDVYENVFQRADGRMYEQKTQMKQRGENSTVES